MRLFRYPWVPPFNFSITHINVTTSSRHQRICAFVMPSEQSDRLTYISLLWWWLWKRYRHMRAAIWLCAVAVSFIIHRRRRNVKHTRKRCYIHICNLNDCKWQYHPCAYVYVNCKKISRRSSAPRRFMPRQPRSMRYRVMMWDYTCHQMTAYRWGGIYIKGADDDDAENLDKVIEAQTSHHGSQNAWCINCPSTYYIVGTHSRRG